MTNGIVKPNGLPVFESDDSLAAGMLFYGVDLGNGTITDVAGGHTMTPVGLPPNTVTSYGSGINWDNRDYVPGRGYYAETDPSIQNAVDLADAGQGQGFTFGCTFVQLGPVVGVNGLIFGRPGKAAELAPYWNEAFTTTGRDDHTVAVLLNNGGNASDVGEYDFGSYGNLVSVVVAVQNIDANHTARLKFFASTNGVPGVLVSTATVVASSSYGLGLDDENQIMFGSVYHVQTGYNWDSFNGAVFSGFIAGRAWSDAEAIASVSNPYTLLSWAPPLSAASITSVADDVGTLSNGGHTSDSVLTVTVSLSGTGALAGDSLQLYNGTNTGSALGSHLLSSSDIASGIATLQTRTLAHNTTYNLVARITDQSSTQSPPSGTFIVIEDPVPLIPVTWSSAVDGTWQVASNWTPSTAPGVDNSAFITPSGTYTIVDPQTTTVGSIVTAAGATLKITGGTFTILQGGTNAGSVKVEAGATLKILPSTMTNMGTMQDGGGLLDFSGVALTNSSGTVKVDLGSTLALENNTTVIGGTLTNAATVDVTGGTSTLDAVCINNQTASGPPGALALDGNGFTSLPFIASTSASVSLTTSHANDVIIVDILQNGTTVGSVSDSAGLVWHQRAVAGTGSQTIYEYYAIAPSVLSADNITVNFTNTASYVDLNAFGITGANTSSPFDSNPSLPATPANSLGTVSTSNANDYIFAAYRSLDPTPSAGSGWTAINAGSGYYLSEYQVASATQSGLVATGPTAGENGGIVDAVVQASTSTAAATVTIGAGAELDLKNTTITGGTLTNFGTAAVSGGSTTTLKDVGLINRATVTVDAGSTLDFKGSAITGGSLINAGLVDIIGTAISTLTGVDVTNTAAAITVDAGATLDLKTSTITGGAMTNAGTVDVIGGTTSNLDGLGVTNTTGQIIVEVGTTLNVNNTSVTGGTLVNAGTVDSTGLSALNAVGVTNAGLLEATSGKLTIDPAVLVNTGTLLATSGATLDMESISVTNNNGKVKVDAGSTLDLKGTTITGGSLTNAGLVDVGGNGATSTFDSLSVSNGAIGPTVLALDGKGFSNLPFVSSTSASVDLTTSNANDIIVLEVLQNSTTVGSVADTAGLSWHQRAVAGTGSQTIYEYYAIAANALSADNITVNFTGTASYVDLNAFGISGANTASPFDSNASLPATPANSLGAATTSNANDLIFAAYRSLDPTPNAGAGWTGIASGQGYYLSEYQVVSALQAGLVATGPTAGENGGIVDAVVQASAISGTLTVETGSTLDLKATTITGGTVSNGGILDVTGNGASKLDGANLTNTGATTRVEAGSTFDLNNVTATGGGLTNLGTLDLTGIDQFNGLSVTNDLGNAIVEGGAILDMVGSRITGGTLASSGIVAVTGNSTSTLDGVSLTNGSALVPPAPLAIDGKGFTSLPFVPSTSASVGLTTSHANDVIVLEVLQNGTTVGSVSDTAGLTWHQRAVAGTGSQTIYEYYAIAANALTADNITVNFTGTASYVDLNAFGISGANTASPFDSSASLPATPANSLGAATTSNANDLIFAAYRSLDPTPGAGAGWTAIASGQGYYLSEYQVVSAVQAGLVATGPTAGENGGIVDAVVQAGLSTSSAAVTVDAGSTLNFNNASITGGALTNAGTVNSTGTSTLSGVAVTNSGTLQATSGALTIAGAVNNTGSLLASAATVDITGAVTGNGTATISGTNAVLEFGAASSAATTFATGPAGLLKLDAAETFTGNVAGFAANDAIDMTDFLFANNPMLTVAGSGLAGTYTDVTVHDGALSETIALLNQLDGQYAVDPTAYALASDNPANPNAGTLFQLAAHA